MHCGSGRKQGHDSGLFCALDDPPKLRPSSGRTAQLYEIEFPDDPLLGEDRVRVRNRGKVKWAVAQATMRLTWKK